MTMMKGFDTSEDESVKVRDNHLSRALLEDSILLVVGKDFGNALRGKRATKVY